MTKVSQDKFFGADERTLWDNRDAARKRLARPVGRTQEIDGRRYLRLEDYANWKGRSVKGKLVKEPGILAASCNGWRMAQGSKATLAHVPVGPVTCWAANTLFGVHEVEEVSKLVQERADLLAGFRRWTLHDFDREPGYFTRPSSLHKRSFVEEVAAWRDQALCFAQEVFALREALGKVAERYFEGNRLLFDDERDALEAQANVWQLLREHFSDMVVVELERVGEDAPNVPRLGIAEVEEAGRVLGQDRAAYLVDLAKADALRTLGELNAAAEVMERHVADAGISDH